MTESNTLKLDPNGSENFSALKDVSTYTRSLLLDAIDQRRATIRGEQKKLEGELHKLMAMETALLSDAVAGPHEPVPEQKVADCDLSAIEQHILAISNHRIGKTAYHFRAEIAERFDINYFHSDIVDAIHKLVEKNLIKALPKFPKSMSQYVLVSDSRPRGLIMPLPEKEISGLVDRILTVMTSDLQSSEQIAQKLYEIYGIPYSSSIVSMTIKGMADESKIYSEKVNHNILYALHSTNANNADEEDVLKIDPVISRRILNALDCNAWFSVQDLTNRIAEKFSVRYKVEAVHRVVKHLVNCSKVVENDTILDGVPVYQLPVKVIPVKSKKSNKVALSEIANEIFDILDDKVWYPLQVIKEKHDAKAEVPYKASVIMRALQELIEKGMVEREQTNTPVYRLSAKAAKARAKSRGSNN